MNICVLSRCIVHWIKTLLLALFCLFLKSLKPLRTSKSGVCLGQNWMFVARGKKGLVFRNLDIFLQTSKMNEPLPKSFFCYWKCFFFVFPCLFTLCSFIGGKNLKINLKMHDTQVSFIWMKELQNKIKLSMTKKSSGAC